VVWNIPGRDRATCRLMYLVAAHDERYERKVPDFDAYMNRMIAAPDRAPEGNPRGRQPAELRAVARGVRVA